jgi:hypothetical protein
VERTGIALVHAGELVLPAPGSEAELEPASADPRAVVEYHFPVVIELREAPAPDVDTVARRAAWLLVQGLRD